jgi:branched-chain amino acid transport system substrate-binding protein
MKMSTRRRRQAACAVIAVSALTLGACSSKAGTATTGDNSAPGVTANSILLGTTQPLTGPAATGYSKISAAMKAYFDFVNANGGVNGRKITLKILDDGYNPANTITDTHELIQQDHVFALLGALGTPTHTAVLDFIKQNKVPDLFVSSGSRSWDQPTKYPTTFGWQPDYTIEGKVLGSYVKQNFAGKKICSFGQGDDFGLDGVAGVKLTVGTTLTKSETYTPTNTNVAPQIAALKAAGCQVIVSFTVPGFTALEMGTAAALKFAPQYVVSNVGSDITTLTTFLKTAAIPLTNGMVTDTYLPLTTDASNSWTTLFKKVDTQYDGNAAYDGNVEYGMALAYTFVQALKAAGKTLTRGTLVAAAEKGGFTGPGLVPFRLSKTDHSGYSGVQVVKVQNGVGTTTGPIYTTDDASAGLTAYTGKQPTAPTNGLPN